MVTRFIWLIRLQLHPSGGTAVRLIIVSVQVMLYVPKTSSASCDQAIFVDQATDASLSLDAVLVEIDRFG
jgi:hypothetical protein